LSVSAEPGVSTAGITTALRFGPVPESTPLARYDCHAMGT